jgi:serine/threonine-protein kinase
MGDTRPEHDDDSPKTRPAETIARAWGSETQSDGSDATEHSPPLASAARFTLVREIGRGGMGRVDEVFDSVLGRAVAQKSVLPGANLLQATLLVSEAQTCAQLEHPSIVPVYDLGSSAEGDLQYTMRLVRGRTFRKVLQESTTLAQRLGILRQVCLAVAYAHGRGVVHRDLKPDNVVCGEFGEVYVLDWGIAQLVDGSDVRRATHAEIQGGSPGYVAPEQMLAPKKKITPAADVFALGSMLYEIVTGKRAFRDEDLQSLLRRCEAGLDVPPSRSDPRAPPAFDALVLRCLANDPDERPSAREVATAIDSFLDGERARAEREREAEAFCAQGEKARAAFAGRRVEVERLRDESDELLDAIPLWESAEKKDAAWKLGAEADATAKDAARDLAQAQVAFARALGRVAGHARARRGLASLHWELFEMAEEEGDADAMAQHLDLARIYDDGALALELANEGALVVEASATCALAIARYEPSGRRLVLGAERSLRAGESMLLEAGSYVVFARVDGRGETVRYPLRVTRARLHRLKLRIPERGEVPEGMVLVPGGPFFAAASAKATRMCARALPDFAIGIFPVTWGEYTRFLESLAETDRARRFAHGEKPFVARDAASGVWSLTTYAVEGPARERIPAGRELDIPAAHVSFYDALAYVEWSKATRGRPFRLPTELEWEKALRGADGRRFSMGEHLDPAFAKLRESRPEYAQQEVVGAFATDESPFGVRDLTGGVGDWTTTFVDGAPAPAIEDEGKPEADSRQAIWRGGCYGTTALFPHAMRYPSPLVNRLGWVGFRVALSLDHGGSSSLESEPMQVRASR